MPVVTIDPEGVVALATATGLSAVTLHEEAAALAATLDGIAALAPGGPAVRARCAVVEADLAALAGAARQRAQDYGAVERPLRELATLGFWFPDFGVFVPDEGQGAGEDLEDLLRSDEFGAIPLGLSQSLLEAYRKPSLVLPKAGLELGVDLSTLVGVVDEFHGVPMVTTPGGLLVPAGSAEDPFVKALTARSQGGDFHQPGKPTFVTEGVGRPPGWARVGGRALGAAGAALTLYDSFAGQWEEDAALHPEYSTGQRIASASATTALEGGGAVAGGLAGAYYGAMVGSLVPVPVIGTVGGALIGGAIGSFAGSKAGKAAGTAVVAGAKEVISWFD
ncbi:hypothetical protein [Kineococcus sp. SYSU DK002]|uniref:hypothetical protein n=1 Tax=Kineococcus sp. SYSU DK002 TaxID=3383123 RepID=UPI003D7D55D3